MVNRIIPEESITVQNFNSGVLTTLLASTPGNGDKATGGAAGATIPGALIGAGTGGTSIPPGAISSAFSNYLELVAKRSAFLRSKFETNCPGYFIQGSCEDGHRYAKELYCGREWCPVCGEEWSNSHQRRFSRWLPKAFQMKSMGYFVFTLPPDVRNRFRTKKALSRLGSSIQDILKSYGFDRGLRRWHFMGDKSNDWHPHLNVLVDGNYIPDSKLDRIKRSYAALLGVEVADVNYHYRKTAGEKVHTLKYVTRATFRDYTWDEEMAYELKGFRNQLWWGHKRWNEPEAWTLADLKPNEQLELESLDSRAVASLEVGECPECKKSITWGGVMPIEALHSIEGKRELGAGYWELPRVRPSPLENTVLIKARLSGRPDADPGGHHNRTYDGYHQRHRDFAVQWECLQIADQEREALWNDILGRAS